MYIKNKFSVNSTTNREATVLCFNFEVLTAVLICICVVHPFSQIYRQTCSLCARLVKM